MSLAPSKFLLAAAATAATSVLTTAPSLANNPPTVTITTERYLKPNLYLLKGSISDEHRGSRLVYRVRRKQTVVRLGSRTGWTIRLPLESRVTRLVFYAIDSEGRRSGRQKRQITQQAEPTPTPTPIP